LDGVLSEEAQQDEIDRAGFKDTPWQGIFVMRGQTLSMSSFEITLQDDGTITSTSPTLSTITHMEAYWLEAAIDHAREAERLSHFTDSAFHNDDPDQKCSTLNRELISSMQAISCAAFAIDAFFASLLQVQPTAESTKAAWRKNRTKRSRQIYETIRRAFQIGPESSVKIREFLDQLTDARDRAVHPPSNSKIAVNHGRLPVAVDPAFNVFRARNALVAVGQTVDLIESATRSAKAKNAKIAEKMKILGELIKPTYSRWRRTKAGREFNRIRNFGDT
jgi:hypothetical protein